MEEWVFLGESGSDAETVCSVDDKGSETDFAMVQLRRSHAAESRAKDDGGKNQGDHQEESDDDDDHDYFDLDLPALAGTKAVFGANGDCFDFDLAASILSMGSVGYDSGLHGADADDDIDTVSLSAPDGDGDATVHPERVLCTHCANIDTDHSSDAAKRVMYDDIDTGGSDGELSDKDDADQSSDMAELVKHDDIDTGSSDSWESDYGDNDELSGEDDADVSVWAELGEYDDIDTGSSDSSESDHGGNDELSDEDNTDVDIAPQQRRLTAIASWRPPYAPHLFFTQPSRSTYNYKSTGAEEGDDENTKNSSDAAEDDSNYETGSYSAKGDNGDDHTKTSYTSLTHRDEVISGFVGTMMARADALARFDAVESALELPQYSLSRSDINAWKAAFGKGRAEIAARPRPPVAPHLFFTTPRPWI